MRNVFYACCLGVGILLLCHPLSASEFQIGLQTELDESFKRLKGVPGVAIAVDTPDQGNIFAGTGTGNTQTGEAVQAQQRFRVASISKFYTAALVMKLQELGYLQIDDLVSQHLVVPGLPHGDSMTIRQLMDHSAGVYDHINGTNDFWSIALADPYKVWSDNEIMQYAVDNGPVHTPGSQYSYSNTGSYLLGLVVESVTGMPLSSALSFHMLEPLQLTQSFMDDWSNPGSPISQLAENDRAYEFHKTGIMAAGAVVANSGDVASMARGVLGGQYLSTTSVTQMTSPSANNSGYGLSTYIWDAATYGYLHYGHTGTLSGYKSIVMYVPEFDVSIAILSNGYANNDSSWYTLIDNVFNYVTGWYAQQGGGNCQAPGVSEWVIDNQQATLNGNWQSDNRGNRYYGSNFLLDEQPSVGQESARYDFTGLAAGIWQVSAYYPANRNYASNTPISVTTDTDTYVMSLDQSNNGGQWNSLGSFSIMQGGSLSTTINTSGANGSVIADAIRVQFVDCLP
ncbi:serine hydrolase [Lacimicrobium sp. SS2-24]|uniref:serine hydrolase n=1 Tax=Lacimicrobium sp. SS2-24 TaxID=2005569 RepID=UPI000B4AE58D|nr:serine hydrolase [Lacimicrobium sp. SS2-24]